MKLAKYRIIVFLISLLGLIVPLSHAKPVVVMIASQAFGALHLPVTVACIFYLGNKKDIVGDNYTYSLLEKIILALILVASLFFSYSGLVGLFNTLRQM